MGIMQDSFNSSLQEQIHNIGSVFIESKLREKGITLTPSQLVEIESKLLHFKGDAITINIDDKQLSKVNIKWKDEIKDTLRLNLSISEQDIEDLVDRIRESISEKIPQLVEDLSRPVLKQLRKDASSMLKDRKRVRTSFEARLNKRWRKPIRLLEMLLVIALEAGESFNREHRAKAAEQKDYVFEVLTRLHARACQVATEILVLLKSGHADGAHARWRSLHEISVVGLFIESAGNEVAERYLLHDAIGFYKAARQYQERCEQFGYEPISEEELKSLEAAHQHLVGRFGPGYKEDYGWAAAATDKKKTTLRDIEESARLDRLRPYYRMASHNVHANPKGVFFELGLAPNGPEVLLAGPSNTGLADPGQLTAISLGQITVALLGTQADIDGLVISRILLELMDEIGQEFAKTQAILEEEGFGESSMESLTEKR